MFSSYSQLHETINVTIIIDTFRLSVIGRRLMSMIEALTRRMLFHVVKCGGRWAATASEVVSLATSSADLSIRRTNLGRVDTCAVLACSRRLALFRWRLQWTVLTARLLATAVRGLLAYKRHQSPTATIFQHPNMSSTTSGRSCFILLQDSVCGTISHQNYDSLISPVVR